MYSTHTTVYKASFQLDGIFRAERSGYCLNTFPWRNRPQANQIAYISIQTTFASDNKMINNEIKQRTHPLRAESIHLVENRIKYDKNGFPLDGIFCGEEQLLFHNRRHTFLNLVTSRGKFEISSTFAWWRRPQANQLVLINIKQCKLL